MATTSDVKKTTELLVVTKNELGAFARITTPLAKNNINIECYSAYEWNSEAAFRLVTDNNKKATEILKTNGYTVTESPVVLWQTESTPGQLRNATTALAEANINTYCSYSTTPTNSKMAVAVFNTSDATRTSAVLSRMK